MKRTTILICDDNIAVHESLTSYLHNAGMDVLSLYNGSQIIDIIQKETIDLIILDVMLPGVFGTDLCREIRRVSDVPILMLSARSEEDDRILGLALGADDYVTKPFSPREVVIRVSAILKRSNADRREPVLLYSNLTILSSCKARIGSEPLELTPKELAVLKCLVLQPDTIHSRDLILDEVWGCDYCGDSRAVDTIVKRLRGKLSQAGALFTIRSVYGMGYTLEEKKAGTS